MRGMAASLIVVMMGVTHISRTGQNPVGQTAPSAQPTLKETEEWLQSNLPAIAATYTVSSVRTEIGNKKKPREHRYEVKHIKRIQGAKFDNCSMQLTTETRSVYTSNPGTSESAEISIYNIPLGKLGDIIQSKASRLNEYPTSSSAQSSTTHVIVPEEYFSIEIVATSKVINFMNKLTDSDSSLNDTGAGLLDRIILEADDAHLGHRVSNALNHAIKLCHNDAKPEPF